MADRERTGDEKVGDLNDEEISGRAGDEDEEEFDDTDEGDKDEEDEEDEDGHGI